MKQKRLGSIKLYNSSELDRNPSAEACQTDKIALYWPFDTPSGHRATLRRILDRRLGIATAIQVALYHEKEE